MYIDAHRCIYLTSMSATMYIDVHRCASMCIDVHRCASMCIDVHNLFETLHFCFFSIFHGITSHHGRSRPLPSKNFCSENIAHAYIFDSPKKSLCYFFSMHKKTIKSTKILCLKEKIHFLKATKLQPF
eukprot:Lithocolla_globosa_v1_NODE_1288_length_2698_cov_11.370034.p2 type:complete len:128 gc:universal NODE_1288_length_2698_cov_11.370034:1886-1503(-)